MTLTTCPCGNPRRADQRNCRACHAAQMRRHRATHPLSVEQKRKDNCRSYAQVYLKRGKIQRLPCVTCASPQSQMHHEDYTKPLTIVWMCRPCWGKVRKESVARNNRNTAIPQKDPFACISR